MLSDDDAENCPFCRQHQPKDQIKALHVLMDKNNHDAYMAMAQKYKKGEGVSQSFEQHLEMLIRAADLGNVDAYAAIALIHEGRPKYQVFLDIAERIFRWT
mmetsp:Transcript_20816/g.45136  ORF Transcript_20816/g.45136 Transcript_20816/m.45136 type:complete len:101 (+) Transcript_20816:332-634(+)